MVEISKVKITGGKSHTSTKVIVGLPALPTFSESKINKRSLKKSVSKNETKSTILTEAIRNEMTKICCFKILFTSYMDEVF